MGHPGIAYKDFGDISQYFGIAKVKVYPPRGLYFPVLPYSTGGKLTSSCAPFVQKQNMNKE